MSTHVDTTSRCDRCDYEYVMPGAEGNFPPVGWWEMRIGERAPGAGWSGGGRKHVMQFCGGCASDVLRFAERNPVADRVVAAEAGR